MANSLLHDYDRVGRLFLQALGSGSHGFFAAYRVLQICPGPFPWKSLLEKLCMKVPFQDELTGKLILKPKLLQLPIQLQRNLFSILNFLFHLLPTPCIQLLAEIVRTEQYVSDDWLLYLTHQFLKYSDHVQRTQGMEKLRILCAGLNPSGSNLSKLGRYKRLWDASQTDCRVQFESETPLEDTRGSTLNVYAEELLTTSQSHTSVEAAETTKEAEEIPSFIKGHIINLKQTIFLELDSETVDQDYLLKLKNICEICNPLHLQAVFSSVGVKQISLKCLLQLCTHLDSISPDLSYAHAESLVSILFLDQVLSLSAPASRTFTAALTVFCRKYAWPACNTLISPILAKAETEIGSVYADFLCRMICECLESHELHLCFEPIFKVPCSEVSVSVLHMLVDKKEKLNQSEFDLLLNHLGLAAENLSKSMAFSKLLLVLLTSKKNLIQLSHIGLLINSLNSNQTFMKKSLQNALKKVQENLK